MNSLAIINNKGGTGKTTTSVSIAACMANNGKKILLLDLDAQASASISLGIKLEKLEHTMVDLLFDEVPLNKTITHTSTPNLDIVCGEMELANADIMLADQPGRENILKNILQKTDNEYDTVILDCPPSLSMLSINALVASQYFIVPLTAEYLALEGLFKLMETVRILKHNMEIEAKLLGILVTMVTTSIKMTKEYKTALEVIETVRKQFSNEIFQRFIRHDIQLSRAPANGKTIFEYDKKSRAAKEYTLLVKEIEERWKNNQPKIK